MAMVVVVLIVVVLVVVLNVYGRGRCNGCGRAGRWCCSGRAG